MIEKDSYKTITKASEGVLFKDRNSKFFGYAFPVTSEEEVKQHLETLKKQHHQAGHFCYAYQIGKTAQELSYRANDDGEPNNSAGMPIYGQIQSFEVTDILIVVLRYFGGTKLGVSGLINAYKTTAEMGLNASKIVKRTINVRYAVRFDYKNMGKVMRIAKEKNLNIVAQTLELSCEIIISVRLKKSQEIFEIFDAIFEVEIKNLND
ncbi:YigZ family protein [Subsaximicrobium wynnwilliamsii]|uniref:YigZ family protein n=1 Tax=Subsaximicrobium wynnwilliamsii TaxID=291179 RepID=A0A5C6ZLP3_9FLAO|nr:YigZ family protein [Subsaximicrobium wynnwilliamsii]TXD85175.1 YigZ family protein [Subsaximicrobium wynnwilliamsii]TXD91218.1 YigZ family protein [Subsaximicrobium wynnwilliamsii]TXE04611.1 YigZ family protein [Subsaximicrobium wynnwilliamsii]